MNHITTILLRFYDKALEWINPLKIINPADPISSKMATYSRDERDKRYTSQQINFATAMAVEKFNTYV